jgi:hypothetical protein
MPLLGIGALAQPPREQRGARNDATAILRRMVMADQRVAYQGREVFQRDGAPAMEQCVKRDPRRGVRRESVRPSGELFVDDNTRAWMFSRNAQRYIERESFLPKLRQRAKEAFDQIRKGELQLSRQGQDIVAGRSCDILLIEPREGASGPARRFWIDRESGLRLRTEERSPDGRIVSSSYFLSIDLSPTFDDNDFTAPQPPPGVKIVQEKRRTFATIDEAIKAGIGVHPPTYLPSGYTLRAVDVTGERIALRWGNGITMLSLMQMSEPPRREGPPAKGPIALPGGNRGYAFQDGGRYYFLIGSLTDEELKRIADSVR